MYFFQTGHVLEKGQMEVKDLKIKISQPIALLGKSSHTFGGSCNSSCL